MNYFLQTDKKIADLNLGASGLKVRDYGCFIVSLANLYQVDEATLIAAIRNEDLFTKSGLLYSDKAANFFGGSRATKSVSRLVYQVYLPCIVKYKTQYQYPYHFCLYLGGGTIIDPLSGKRGPEPVSDGYEFVEYRLFDSPVTAKEESKLDKQVVIELCQKGWGEANLARITAESSMQKFNEIADLMRS